MIQKLHSYKPSMTIRVGISGPKIDELPRNLSIKELIEKIAEVLGIISRSMSDLGCANSDFYNTDASKRRLIFAPTGGLEFLAAGEALHLGYDLQLLLPFSHETYSNLFFPSPLYDPLKDALSEIVKEHSTEVVELDGSPSDKESALENARQILLKQCDVLIAIWDGKQGQTEQLIRDALSRDLPTITIHHQKKEIYLCQRGPRSAGPLKKVSLSTLPERLRSIFILADMPGHKHRAMNRFLKAHHPRGLPIFKKFRNFVAHRWKASPKHAARPEQDPWVPLPGRNAAIGAKINDKFRRHFERADQLANAYGDLYRSLFLTTYALGALAVLSAFYGIYFKDHGAFWIEFFLITVIGMIVAISNLSLLHERWVDYRFLGEGLRQMEFLAPLARVTPAFEVPAHLELDDPVRTWFNWYFRALAREAGLVSSSMNRRFLNKYREFLAAAILEQANYHTDTAHKMKLVHERLHFILAWILFPATAIACVAHIMISNHEEMDFYLSLLAIFLPATGAAIEGIIHQGEFARIERRSEAHAARLKSLHSRLTETERPESSRDLGNLAEYFCQMQILEQADWRAAFVTKSINPS